MTSHGLLERALNNQRSFIAETVTLCHAEVVQIVEHIKEEADHFWSINANQSLQLAELIVSIGRAISDLKIEALGIMARADALRLLGRNLDAWEAFAQAGTLFEAAADDVGWARTRLGRIGVGQSLGRLEDALADVERARTIFKHHNQTVRLVILDLNLAAVHQLNGHYEAALGLYGSALKNADDLGEAGETYRGAITTNLGLLYTMLGNHRRAIACQQEALALFEHRGDETDAAIARLNLADTYLQQGQYRRALQFLYQVRAFYAQAQLPRHAAEAGRSMVEALLQLNRYEEARETALATLKDYRTFAATYGQAQTLLLLGMAELGIGQLDAASEHLEASQTLFRDLDVTAWAAIAQLRRAEVVVAQGQFEMGTVLALEALRQFKTCRLEVHIAEAELLLARLALVKGDEVTARHLTRSVLTVARRSNVPDLRYNALLLRGRVCEASNLPHAARRNYEAAVLMLERVERELTVTLRSDFLQNRSEASRRLFELNLRTDRNEQAWRTLERLKAHDLAAFLTGRGALRWKLDDTHGAQLLAELEELRAEQHWLYRQTHTLAEVEPSSPTPVSDCASTLTRLRMCEKRIRTISEQLHLSGGERNHINGRALPALADVCASLPDQTLLIEYGSDGERLWAFLLDQRGLRVQPLSLGIHQAGQLIAMLRANIDASLQLGLQGCTAPLDAAARRFLQRLDTGLRASLPVRWDNYRQVIVVPFGPLHYLPFHLLHDGTAYLLDRHEVVILPAAALVMRPRLTINGDVSAFALAHSHGGTIPYAVTEAQLVAEQFGGSCLVEAAATRRALSEAHQFQLIHIAAHCEHRADAPEFSFIELADGQVQADDLFQLDLEASLVTLSACETGRAVVAPGDDLIGLGRSLLYAGARSLLLAQWRADDAATLALMRRFYQELRAGATKAAALRTTQQTFLADHPDAHPAFWGTFQLVGDGGVL